MKSFKPLVSFLFLLLMVPVGAIAGGPFGPPEPIVKGTGGLHTGIGYWLQEERYQNGTEQLFRQNQIYSEAGYGSRRWEITGRIGMADLKLGDAFRSSAATTVISSRANFEEHWKFFGTLGVKAFYPVNATFGLGAFLQGSYAFSDFTDSFAGTRDGTPFVAELRVKNLWDVNAGLGLQATVFNGTKLYGGPYLRHSEGKVWSSRDVAGIALAAGETTLKNRTAFGGYAGVEAPLGKGFRLTLEGQYGERLSAGAAIVYVY
jgi:hypothetical protein